MNTYYCIVIETYFIWSWARNASFCSLKNLNSTAVCGTAILKALQNDLPYKFCFWPLENFKCGNKDEFMITFSSQRFKQQKRSFPSLKVMSSLWILLPNNSSNSCSIYTSKFCEVHLFDGNPLPTYRHTALPQPEALKMRKFSGYTGVEGSRWYYPRSNSKTQFEGQLYHRLRHWLVVTHVQFTRMISW